MRAFRWLVTAVIVAGIGLFLFRALSAPAVDTLPVREAVIESATEDTGAVNLVSAIYLGYRAFDTVGETIVLLLAVAGSTYLIRSSS